MSAPAFFSHQDPIGEYRWRNVAAETDGLAEAIWAYGGATQSLTPQILAPHWKVCLAVERLWERGGARPSHARLLLLGPVDQPRLNQNPAGYEIIAARLNPEHAARVLGVTPDEIANQDVPFSSFPGADALMALAGTGAGASLIGEALLGLLRRMEMDSRNCATAHAAALIRASDGNVSVKQLSEATGLTDRTLRRRFISELGISPKLYARTVRLKSLLMHADRERAPSWCQLALEYGYADQSHMCTDASQLTGYSPARLHALRRGDAALALLTD